MLQVPLREEQILRYSRQILLEPVGGVGQMRLLAWGAEFSCDGEASMTAAAVLAASGTPVRFSRRGARLSPCAAGYLASPEASAIAALNLDSAEPVGRWGFIDEGLLTAPARPPHARVVVGTREGRGMLVGRTETACASCFDEAAREVLPAAGGAEACQLGMIAALAFQRMVLGLADGVGTLLLEDSGAWAWKPVLLCRHAP